MSTRRRIAVTGLGIVCPIGTGRESVWDGLLRGRSGFAEVASFDVGPYPVRLGAEVRDFDPAPYFRRTDPASAGRASQLAVAAARLAIADAGLGDELGIDPFRGAVVLGTTSGEPREIERYDDDLVEGAWERIDPAFVARYPCHVIATRVAAELNLGGPNAMIPAACAAGNYAVAHAYDLLRDDRADLALAGGADAFSRITYTGFSRLGAIAPETCQPFDRLRRGMIPGEGAAMLVLEPLDRAQARGARIYAEVAGYGLSCDAHHMTAAHPEGDGAARAMLQALRHAGLAPEDIAYVSAHGTGTPTNDRLETKAVYRVFGARAAKTPISSIKSMIGHTMGAASAIEAAVCALAVATGRVPPTMNYRHRDPDCDLDCVPNAARELPVAAAMNNAYAFGGNNASVIFREVRS